VSDPNYASVSLLLHCNGSDGATAFADDGPVGHTVTVVGGAQVDTESPKYGSGALLLDGTGDYLTVPYHAGLHLSTGDLTIEFWAKHTSGTERYLMSFGSTSTVVWEIFEHSSGYLRFAARDNDDNTLLLANSGGAMSSGTWYHLAITRSGNTWRFFVDGIQRSTTTSSLTLRASASAPDYRLVIGAHYSGVAAWIGQLDDIRITAGVARYTENFTPPSAEFEGAPATEILVTGTSPLGPGAALLASTHVRVAGSSPLGSGQVQLQLTNILVAGGSPLGTGAALLASTHVRVAGGSPLGPGAAVLASRAIAVAAGTPLGAGAVKLHVPAAIRISGGTPLGSGKAQVWHDFTGALDPRKPAYYVMDLITPDGRVRVPISSWQATLQTDAACYVQCVVPAAANWAASIALATEFAILRRAELPGGQVVEYEMARTELDPSGIRYDRGGSAYTVTLSGYPDAFAANSNPPTVYDRQLVGVRSQNNTSGGTRVVCDIDWLLRPGHRAYVDDLAINVAYINYYAPGGDHYMDIGERI